MIKILNVDEELWNEINEYKQKNELRNVSVAIRRMLKKEE